MIKNLDVEKIIELYRDSITNPDPAKAAQSGEAIISELVWKINELAAATNWIPLSERVFK